MRFRISTINTNKAVHTPLLALALVAQGLTGCGSDMEPSGGRSEAAAAAPTASAAEPPADPTAAAGTADAVPTDALRQSLATPLLTSCNDQGFVLDRRRGECSGEYRLATYACDRAGIRSAFAGAGFQIDQILDRSLGYDGTDNVGEGFVIDQCGESDTHRIVYLASRNAEGRILLREIEVLHENPAAAPAP